MLWPFFVDTRTLIPPGDTLNTLTPLLGIASGAFFLLAAAALLGWWIPSSWFPALVVAGVVASIPLQVVWLSVWTIVPLLGDASLLWVVFGLHATKASLSG